MRYPYARPISSDDRRMATYRYPGLNGHATEIFRTAEGNAIVAPASRPHVRQERLAAVDAGSTIQEHRTALMALYGGAQLSSVQAAGDGFYSSRHPILQLSERMFPGGSAHGAQLAVFHAMRQYCPTLDAAIKNRRALEGNVVVTSRDQGLADRLNAFIEGVAVGYIGGRATHRGLNTYLNMMAGNADEYGLSAGEILTDERGTEIQRLVVPNARTLSMEDRDQDGIHELYQSQDGRKKRLDDQALVQVLSFTFSTEAPWPHPLAWSLVKSSEVLLRMYEAVVNGWWRFGDPSMLFGIEYDAEADVDTQEVASGSDTVEVPQALFLFKNSMEQVMKARRHGKVGDTYAYSDGGEIKSEVIGDIDASLLKYFKEHSSLFDGHIIAHSETPIWMYPHVEQSGDGLGSSRSNNQALVSAVAAEDRNKLKRRLAREVLDTYLLLSGDGRHVGRYELEFDQLAILDEKIQAETRKEAAAADAQVIKNVEMLFEPETGARRFEGEANDYLEQQGILS